MDFRFSPEEEAFRQEVRELAEDQPARRTGTGDRCPRTGDPEEGDEHLQGLRAAAGDEEVGRAGAGRRSTAASASRVMRAAHLQRGDVAGQRADRLQRRSASAGPARRSSSTAPTSRRSSTSARSPPARRCGARASPSRTPAPTSRTSPTRAVRDGDDYVINGQKIWTSGAHYADWMILIARTDPDAPKHKGISYFLVDMKTPGITTRPAHRHDEQPRLQRGLLRERPHPAREPPRRGEPRLVHGDDDARLRALLDRRRRRGRRKMLDELVEYTRGHAAATATACATSRACAARLGGRRMEAELGTPALVPRGRRCRSRGHGAELRGVDRQAVQHGHEAADGAAPACEIMGLYGQLDHKSKWRR